MQLPEPVPVPAASRPETLTEDRSASGPPQITATVALGPADGSARTSRPSLPSRRHVLLGLAGTVAAAGMSWAAAALAEHYYADHPVPPDAKKATGKWLIGLPSAIASPPILAHGRVYVTTRGSLAAKDAATGTHLWSADTDASRTAVTSGGAYLVGRAYVKALDAATGKNRWSFHADSELYGWLSVVDGVAYTGGKDAAYAIDVASGEQRWKFRLRRAMSWDPVVADGVAYIVGGGTVYAVNTATGERHWTFTAGDEVSTSPRLVDGVLYVGRKSNSGNANTLYGGRRAGLRRRDPQAPVRTGLRHGCAAMVVRHRGLGLHGR